MQTSQARTGNFVLAKRVDRPSVFAKFLSFFASLRGKLSGADDQIAARYDGMAWCDSTERHLTNEIMTGIRTRC